MTIGRKSRAPAFTLVELILVMLVIATVLAVSAPMMRGFFKSRQPADAATSVLSLTQYAHTQAISRGQVWRLNVDARSGKYWLTYQKAGAFVRARDDMGRDFSVPEGVTVRLCAIVPGTPEPTYIQFLPSGRCEPASVEICGAQGQQYLVSTACATESFSILTPTGGNQ